MERSEKGVSSSSSVTPKRAPSAPKRTDENDQSSKEMGIYQNVHKKPTPTKQFMSPTISTASKANLPRKKVLSERNTESHESHPGKSPIPDTRASPKTPSLELTASFSTELGENQENSGLADDISSRPYDPITNYLSPRPRFLWYKANRRRDALRSESDDVKKEDEGSDHTSSGSSAAVAAEVIMNEDREDEESEAEFGEMEDDRNWSLRGILKFLLLVLVLVLCTSYISEMNSPTPSPVVKTVSDLKDVYRMIQDHVYNFMKRNGGEEEEKSKVVKMAEVEESSDDLNEAVEMESEMLDVFEEEEKRDAIDIVNGAEFEEAIDIVEDKGKEAIEVLELQAVEIAEGGNAEESDEAAVNCKLQEAGTEEVFVKVAVDSALQETETAEVSDKFAANSALQETEAAEASDKVAVISKLHVSFVEDVSELGVQDLEKEDEIVSEPAQCAPVERELGGLKNVADDYYSDHGDIIDEAKGLIDCIKSRPTSTSAIGVAISSIIASLVLALHFKKRRNAVQPPAVMVPFYESPMAERSRSVLAEEEEDNNTENPVSVLNTKSSISSRQEGGVNTEHPVSLSNSESLISSRQDGGVNTEHLVSLPNSKSSIISRQEGGATMSQSRAPSVQLLSEFTVVGEIGSSLRSCGMKSRMVESGEMGSHSASAEREVSNRSVSAQKEVSTNAYSLPARIEPASSDISSMNSPSYGIFTTEKMIVEKEEGGNGDVKKAVTTPVRRSSRIRNRGIVSP